MRNKKFAAILCIIFILVGVSFLLNGCNVVLKIFDLQVQEDKKAASILNDFLINIPDKEVKPEDIRAYEFDLNDDGMNEVIGVVCSEKYSERAGCHLFILQKRSYDYQDISGLYVDKKHEVVVLKSKANGYYSLKLYESKNLGGLPYLSKYSGTEYYNAGYIYNDIINNLIKKLHNLKNYLYQVRVDNIHCYKRFNLQVSGEESANKVLYNYILNDLNMQEESLKDFARLGSENISGYEFDLNCDGTNEILGIAYSTYYFSQNGYHLFILQKDLKTGEYRDISDLNIEPSQNLFVLKEKTKDYHNLMFYTSNQPDRLPFLAVFDSGVRRYYRNKLIH